jgi:hypothetical protein
MGFIITSCYEEPIIEPIARPYSSVRVGNFSYNQAGFSGNIDQFSFYVDGVLKGTVNLNTFTDYFDLPSGDRRFVLISGTDTIYNNDVTITSYEEISLVFDGVYAPSVDTLMSFAPYPITDGYVYFYEAPDGDSANVSTSNLAPNTSTENQIKYSLAFVSANFDTTVGGNIYEYNTTRGLAIPAGDYTVWVLTDTTSNAASISRTYDTLSVSDLTFTAGMKENLFITGNPNTPVVIKNQLTPLAVRPK